MYRSVVFDLDGTLINSIYDISKSMNKALSKNGLKEHDTEKYYKYIGDGVDNLIKRAIGKESIDGNTVKRVKKDFNEYYELYKLEKTEPYKGVVEMLKKLNKKDVDIAILSNKPDEFVNSIVSKMFADIKIKACWGKKDIYKTKPNPESLLEIIKEIEANIKNTLYVGDSNVDVETAINARVDFCGVNWGFRGKKELIDSGATKTVNTVNELMEYII